MKDGKIVQSVAKSMQLLEILNESSHPLPLVELSARTGLAKSTIHGLLSTMKEYSVIAQDEDGNYTLGIRLFEYACSLRNTWSIVEVARPYIDQISQDTGEAVFLSVMDRGSIITLDHADNRRGFHISADIGRRLPIHCTSEGKLFLAYMSDREREEILQGKAWKTYTTRTILSRKELDMELVRIRKQGYATENSEYKMGLRSIAAPIFDGEGAVRSALGLIGMNRQIETKQFEQNIRLVVDAAAKITRQLNALPTSSAAEGRETDESQQTEGRT